MTNDINMQLAASQRPASGAGKAQEALASAQSAKPDPKTTSEAGAKSEVNIQTKDGKTLNPEQLEQAVERLNDLAQSVRRELRFSLHDDTGRTVITVRDTETEEVIRQIPSDEVLELITRLENSESSLMKDEIV